VSAAVRAIPKARPKTVPVTHAIELVTVKMAEQWLTHNNGHNRPVYDSKVREYTDHMLTGRWQFNGETIGFDETGTLLNGQHRLWAIIESGLPQKFLIVRGLPSETQLTMDQGTRRSPADQLGLAGIGTEIDRTIAAAVRIYIQWQTGRLFGETALPVTTVEVVDWARNNSGEMALLASFGGMGLKRIKATPSRTYAPLLADRPRRCPVLLRMPRRRHGVGRRQPDLGSARTVQLCQGEGSQGLRPRHVGHVRDGLERLPRRPAAPEDPATEWRHLHGRQLPGAALAHNAAMSATPDKDQRTPPNLQIGL
jgi:hypothetical protein